MSNLSTIQQQIAEVERTKQEALEAERQRMARETESRRIAAQAEQQLTILYEAERQAGLQSAAQQNAALVEQNHQAIAEMFAALDNAAVGLLTAVQGVEVKTNETFLKQQQIAQSAIYNYTADADQRAAAALSNPAGTAHQQPVWKRDEDLRNHLASEFAQAYAVLPNAIPWDLAIREWIRTAPDAKSRLVRQGIALILTGHLDNPGANWSVQAEIDEYIQAQRHSGRVG
jgi:hypothetical protein